MRSARAALILLMAVLPLSAFAYVSPGDPTGFVSDFAKVVPEAERMELEMRLRAFSASTTNEIALVTIPSLQGDYIENYAVKLFDEWGIGSKKNNNGVLVVLAIEDRALRIEVGYGLEGALPDSVADRIIQNEMVPALRNGDYAEALSRGTEAIIAATRGEYTASEQISIPDIESWAPFIMFGFVVLQWLLAILARTKSWWLGGVFGLGIGALLSSVFGWWLLWGLFTTLGFVILGLILDFFVSQTYRESIRSGTTPPWWTGGNSGGFGKRGGGGFGGFGGGRSGGGGASGRW